MFFLHWLQWRSTGFLVWGMQLEIFDRRGPNILCYCELEAKTEFHLMQNSLGLGGTNAPLATDRLQEIWIVD